MWRLEVLRRPDAAERAAIETLVHHVQARTGRRPLSDSQWVALTNGTATGVVAIDETDTDTSRVHAWAQYATAGDGWTLEVTVDPDVPCESADIAALVDRSVAAAGVEDKDLSLAQPPFGDGGIECRVALGGGDVSDDDDHCRSPSRTGFPVCAHHCRGEHCAALQSKVLGRFPAIGRVDPG
jgi:hypothetical protein